MSRMSYVHVPHTCPMEARYLYQTLDSAAERHPDNDALIMYDMDKTRTVMTYSEYRDWSMFLASSLLDLGLSRGHRVLLIGASSIRFAVSIIALHRVGANVILLGPGGLTDDKVKLLKTLNLKMIIFDPAMKDSQMEQLKKGLTGIISVTSSPDTKRGDSPSLPPLVVSLANQGSSQRVHCEYHYDSLLQSGKSKGLENVQNAQADLQLDQPSICVFTSGSTGDAKLVQRVLYPMTGSLHPSDKGSGAAKPQKRMYFDRPMAWGWGYGTVKQMSAGITVVWVPTEMALSNETNETVFDIMAKEKCTSGALGVALIHKLVSEQLHHKYDLSHYKAFTIGGQRYPIALVESVFHCFPTAQATLIYGCTETGLSAMATFCKETLAAGDYGKLTASRGTEVKIVDEDGKLVPRGTPGEICIRSRVVLLEYVGNPVATNLVKSPTGWLFTGDIGIMDDQGTFEVLGRTKEIIKRATVKIFPAEIESVLMKHPVVADAVVIGVPDQRLYEELCACVILTGGESINTEARLAELEAWCAQQWPPGADGLSLKPKYFLEMENFLLTKTGKIDRQGLRQGALEILRVKEIWLTSVGQTEGSFGDS